MQIAKNKNECVVIGARPTVIKFAPIIKAINPFVLLTGQHRELANDALSCFDFDVDSDLKLMRENQTLTDFIARGLVAVTNVIRQHSFKRIWVHGDTSTALIGALSGFACGISVVHNEAGLRSHNIRHPYPEESFRKCVDAMSDIMLAPTVTAAKNLKMERGGDGRIFIVGNTVVDALEMVKPFLSNKRPMEEEYILVTLHRREAFGTAMEEMFEAVSEISKQIKVVFPIHPNPNVRRIANKFELQTCEPMDYKTFMWYMKHCRFLITDSGGLQEEAPSFSKPVLILRKTTERPEAVDAGFSKLVGWDKQKIVEEAIELIQNDELYKSMQANYNPYGDGKSAEKIARLLENDFKS